MKQQQQEQFIREFEQWARKVLEQPGLAVWVVREQLAELAQLARDLQEESRR